MSGGIQRPLSRIRVKDLRLRTFVGFNDEEQRKRQDVVVNLRIDYDALAAARGDVVDEALDYKTITKQIIAHIEDNRFLLLEKLVNDLVELIMAHTAVQYAEVEVDKPHALRFADSVSLTMTAQRD
ncbi:MULTISPECIES: dihydroneopterin triphosphate 2'-epimerase [Spiribacter]|jgi:D-erythro-7,8-dihydroneopterin triphosphate epimerase|uniref:dihydroneopterin triphosphate 2'-epimerase n=1 Tax=Spiribacter TaxID=1335745 RepID=UPI00083F724C|nr:MULTISPECIES: dihydroneopterin triphosphate 2'-epimerase [Spiribacter]PYZ99539.1 dihydroneopterin triphosphate 2'-epimerase [Gammaproteobacteria bacterium 2W06]AUB79070.1 D-erythro-7,8-dihydroneopterin triphosphate epimerase [Spiribacter roseus]KAF0282502.1 D-erythro-7,8-dihydroneopterin triphosphate epimerase [Spiribacter roseus]KAF0284602.1 D-erythro-7,8-dihydroneopterin triphosphate epimerase [Spiribacter roseus]KAF0286559.1 D-erythro-7,8-dihydroneopterin triphosphate epimerase [Spiribac